MIPRNAVLAALLGFLSGCAPLFGSLRGAPATPPLAAELDYIFSDSAFAHAHWGVLIRSLDTGETLYSLNSDRLFVPASNVKLLTGAAILETLGPDYRYRTVISTAGTVSNGVLDGSLIVTGAGDPTFSERFLDEPRATFRAWADSLRAHGITRVTGGVIAVDTAFTDPHIGEGWMWDDLMGSSAAAYAALQFNEGIIEIDVYPSQNHLQPGLVVLTPPTQSVRIINNTRTAGAGGITSLRFSRDELGSGIIIQGEIALDSDGVSRSIAVNSPPEYMISVVRETLREAGISIEGAAIHHSDLENFDPVLYQAIPLFESLSPPLSEILPGMLKPSQNMIAETMLLTVGHEMRGEGTAAAGAAVVDSLLNHWGIVGMPYRMADGSGLSRYNLASPAILIGLLERMDGSEYRDVWLASLPVAGRDGTLESRMREGPLYETVLAKTGTLGGVRSLSGYLTTQSGERIVFSTMVNNYRSSSAGADRIVETALQRIATTR